MAVHRKRGTEDGTRRLFTNFIVSFGVAVEVIHGVGKKKQHSQSNEAPAEQGCSRIKAPSAGEVVISRPPGGGNNPASVVAPENSTAGKA